MISSELEILLNKAIRTANKLKHEFLTIENVLLSLMGDELVANVLKDSGADVTQLSSDLSDFLADEKNLRILV